MYDLVGRGTQILLAGIADADSDAIKGHDSDLCVRHRT